MDVAPALCLGVAVLAIVGGTALRRRLQWPLLLPALLFLSLATGGCGAFGVLTAVGLHHGQPAPWIQNLGIGAVVFSIGSALAGLYFFLAAAVASLRRMSPARLRKQ